MLNTNQQYVKCHALQLQCNFPRIDTTYNCLQIMTLAQLNETAVIFKVLTHIKLINIVLTVRGLVYDNKYCCRPAFNI